METILYEATADRISYDDVHQAIVARHDDRLAVHPENIVPDAKISRELLCIVFEYILQPVVVNMSHGEHIRFWDSSTLSDMGLVALDKTLQPPIEVYAQVGMQAFIKGCFDNNFCVENGGIYAIAKANQTFHPCWETEGKAFVCAEQCDLVSISTLN